MHFNGRLNAQVESDIVGYTTITTVPGFNMLGCVFNGLDGNAATLNDILSGDFIDGDEVQVWDGGYKFRTWNTAKGGWCEGRALSTSPVAPGTGFWLKTPGRSITVTLAGAVPVEELTLDLDAGFQMISANSPIALDLNALTWTNLTNGDEVQFIKPGESGYTFYTYNTAKGGWCEGRSLLTAENAIPVGTSLWLKVSNGDATVKIPSAL